MFFKRKKARIYANLRVGKPDVKLTKPSHVRGVREGNKAGRLEKEPGFHKASGGLATGNARRSTGIAAEKRNPILPEMPNLSPS